LDRTIKEELFYEKLWVFIIYIRLCHGLYYCWLLAHLDIYKRNATKKEFLNDIEVVVTYHTYQEKDASTEQSTNESSEQNNKGRTIEFDGNIAYMSFHENYDTRYDFLIYAGDYSEDSANGSPAMQIKDVNFYDLHLTGDNVPEAIGTGDNLHIIAKVDDFINDYLIILKPISSEIR